MSGGTEDLRISLRILGKIADAMIAKNRLRAC
jgi:hypothetical protein